jgi:hypothetical protein
MAGLAALALLPQIIMKRFATQSNNKTTLTWITLGSFT